MAVSNFGTQAAQDFSGAVATYGEMCRLQYFKETYSGSDYDNRYITKSGTAVWQPGLHFPVNTRTGGEDFKFLQQGRIQMDDKKVFFPPTANLSGTSIKVGIGSPTPTEHFIIPDGVQVQHLQGVAIYKKAYVRRLNTGSFVEEY